MTMDLNFLLASGAVAIAAVCLIAVYAQKKRCNEKQEAVETAAYHVRQACETRSEALKAELKSEFKSAIESLEAGLRGPERALAEGRMGRSTRAEALRLLRSGIAPETAAASLGMPKHDLVLLSKVSNVLMAR
jgi:hypothetical protein